MLLFEISFGIHGCPEKTDMGLGKEADVCV